MNEHAVPWLKTKRKIYTNAGAMVMIYCFGEKVTKLYSGTHLRPYFYVARRIGFLHGMPCEIIVKIGFVYTQFDREWLLFLVQQ